MRLIRITMLSLAALLCAACGGATFRAAPGPFSGILQVTAAEAVGTFSLTTTGALFGGNGTLTHNEQQVPVAISGNIDGRSLSGTIRNANLGSGAFVGTFSAGDSAAGTFTYTDAGEIATTSGTWSADITDIH